MSFFESEIVQKSRGDQPQAARDRQSVAVHPLMETGDRIDFFDAMLDLIERQKVFT